MFTIVQICLFSKFVILMTKFAKSLDWQGFEWYNECVYIATCFNQGIGAPFDVLKYHISAIAEQK